jgi:hypothetical protein
MKIFTPAFKNNGLIPDQYTGDGIDVNPPLEIKEVPVEAISLLLIVDDPDAAGGSWIHWLIWNIDPQTRSIAEDSVPAQAVLGLTSFGQAGWRGPCPPAGTHHYVFKLYALDCTLDLPVDTTVFKLEQVIHDHILAAAELVGVYRRK